jgi:hypothetical protein
VSSVDVDLSDYNRLIDEIKQKFGSVGDAVQQFLDNEVVPVLQSQAGSERNVVTGRYMNDWEAVSDGESAHIETDAYYWKFLEFGTGTIAAKPILPEAVKAIEDGLGEFIVEGLFQ